MKRTTEQALASLRHKYQVLIQKHGKVLRQLKDKLSPALLELEKAERKLKSLEQTVNRQSETIGLMDDQIQALLAERPKEVAALQQQVKDLKRDYMLERQAYIGASYKADRWALAAVSLGITVLIQTYALVCASFRL